MRPGIFRGGGQIYVKKEMGATVYSHLCEI